MQPVDRGQRPGVGDRVGGVQLGVGGQREPLGLLAAYLLEPASEDGIVAWNLLDRELAPHATYPILRARAPLRVAAEELPYPSLE